MAAQIDIVEDVLSAHSDDLFAAFTGVYVFGSALHSDAPSDVDLLLVYDGSRLSEVPSEKVRVLEGLWGVFPEVDIDVTILSELELRETGFLGLVSCRQIKK